jgi:hypothetical protein
MSKQYYDLLSDEKREEIKDFLTKHKNQDKDPNYTRAYSHVVDICPSCKTILVLKKKAEDTRDWNTDEKVNFNLV